MPGDTLTVEFAAPAVAGQVRERFLFSRGVYSSTPFASQPPQSESDVVAHPLGLGIVQTQPNPLTDFTTIRFHVSGPVSTRLAVFDVQGRVVRVLADGAYAAGFHLVEWDGRGETGARVRPGLYFCRLIAGGVAAQTRIMVLRQE